MLNACRAHAALESTPAIIPTHRYTAVKGREERSWFWPLTLPVLPDMAQPPPFIRRVSLKSSSAVATFSHRAYPSSPSCWRGETQALREQAILRSADVTATPPQRCLDGDKLRRGERWTNSSSKAAARQSGRKRCAPSVYCATRTRINRCTHGRRTIRGASFNIVSRYSLSACWWYVALSPLADNADNGRVIWGGRYRAYGWRRTLLFLPPPLPYASGITTRAGAELARLSARQHNASPSGPSRYPPALTCNFSGIAACRRRATR